MTAYTAMCITDYSISYTRHGNSILLT